MKTWEELIADAKGSIDFWKKQIVEKDRAITPYKKDYDLVYAKWERLNNEIEKVNGEHRYALSNYTQMASKLRLNNDHSMKISRLNKQADAFLPEINRFRSHLRPFEESKQKCEINLKESEMNLEIALEGYAAELHYVKTMPDFYTIGRAMYY